MAKSCDVCGRKPMSSQNRSHSKVATKRKQYLNLQSKKIDGVRKKICAKCIRTLNKEK